MKYEKKTDILGMEYIKMIKAHCVILILFSIVSYLSTRGKFKKSKSTYSAFSCDLCQHDI